MYQEDELLSSKILEKKKQHDIYIIAHYYQRGEIQDIADFVGDSYAMALAARNSPSNTILVAGVDFMAQTAAILCPDKTVLSPEPAATCPMANSISIQDIKEFKQSYPDGIVVSYVNTPAEVKAVSDVCCTSSNAEKILRQLPADQRIFFVPDRNLAKNIAAKLEREIDIYPSQCPIHAQVTKEGILRLKDENPQALVLVHPECDPEVVFMADFIGSTAGILNYVAGSPAEDFIIGTECGIFHAIDKASPGKHLILASPELICPNMKSITLEKILYSIDEEQTVITVPDDIRMKAVLALEKMIEMAS
ncbi:MAG TPA: quinolinate synthase NadA [Syntrophomonadaceae bacterium]|nr:quinolinate synthase NadA [Syntrophomonadaceae bacterium]